MTDYFLDSSALVKRYITEPGSQWVSNLFDPLLNHGFFIAAITGVEITAALTRRARGGSITLHDSALARSQFKSDYQTEYQIVEINSVVIASAISLAEKYGLRGYDAVQLAAACAVNDIAIANDVSIITFISADNELNTAALGEGLIVDNPNSYP